MGKKSKGSKPKPAAAEAPAAHDTAVAPVEPDSGRPKAGGYVGAGATVLLVGVRRGGFKGRHGIVRGDGVKGHVLVSLLESDSHEVDPAEGLVAAKPDQLASLCAFCFAPKPRNRCSRCKSASYCGRECQLNGWSYHKELCKEVIAQSSGTRSISNTAEASGLKRRAELLRAVIDSHRGARDVSTEVSREDLASVVEMGFEAPAAEKALLTAARLGGGADLAVEYLMSDVPDLDCLPEPLRALVAIYPSMPHKKQVEFCQGQDISEDQFAAWVLSRDASKVASKAMSETPTPPGSRPAANTKKTPIVLPVVATTFQSEVEAEIEALVSMGFSEEAATAALTAIAEKVDLSQLRGPEARPFLQSLAVEMLSSVNEPPPPPPPDVRPDILSAADLAKLGSLFVDLPEMERLAWMDKYDVSEPQMGLLTAMLNDPDVTCAQLQECLDDFNSDFTIFHLRALLKPRNNAPPTTTNAEQDQGMSRSGAAAEES